MAKKLLTDYTFTPGAANAGTVVVAGTYALEQFLLITNVSTGVVIYQFNKASKGGTVHVEDGNTQLTLEADTSGMSAGDRLQIFIDNGQNPTVSVSGTTAVSATSLPLPTGASTAAKQPALGTAGTPSSDVLTVQGATSMTALKVDGSAVTQPVSGPLTDTQLRATAVPVSGTVTANAGTNLNTSTLALEAGGNLASIDTKLPARGFAQPSASLPIALPNKVFVTGPSGLSALNTNLLTGNVSDWSDAQGYSSVLVNVIQSAGISAGTFVFEGSPDGTTSFNLGYVNITTAAGNLLTGNVTMVASTTSCHFAQIPYRYWRVRISTAVTGGSVQAIATYSNTPQIPIGQSVVTPSGVQVAIDIVRINGTTLAVQSFNGSNASLPVSVISNLSNADYSAQSVAATSGSLSVISAAVGGNACVAFDINLTTFTAGSSTGLDLYLQESPDNGTTFYDIWQVEALTAAGRARIPALPVNGRRRIRWVNRTGAATTATLTVTAMGTPAALPIQRQFFDRTSGVGSGTAVAATNSAAYDIAGCKQISVVMQAGTATAVGSFQVQMSTDGTNWYSASAATAISATTANNTVIPITTGMVGRFIRVTCTAAGTTQVINAIHIYGTN